MSSFLTTYQDRVRHTTRSRTRFREAWISASADIIATAANRRMGVVADGILKTGIVIVTAKLGPRCAGTAFLLAPHTEEARGVDQRVARRHSIGERCEGFLARSDRVVTWNAESKELQEIQRTLALSLGLSASYLSHPASNISPRAV